MHEPQDRHYFLRGRTMAWSSRSRSRNDVRAFAEAIPYRSIWFDDGLEQAELAGDWDTADFYRRCNHSQTPWRFEDIAASIVVPIRKHFQNRIGLLQIAISIIFVTILLTNFAHHTSIGYSYAGVMMMLEVLSYIVRHVYASR